MATGDPVDRVPEGVSASTLYPGAGETIVPFVGEPGDDSTALLRSGDRVDRYVVEAMIGRGATAEVYRVRHSTLGSVHALKLLQGAQRGLRQRMLREGKLQAGLNHKNVVAVHDILEIKGLPALVMDLVEGPSLKQWLTTNRPEPEQLEEMFRKVVTGVRAAHALRIVHRDLKPDNVLLEEIAGGWEPRVTDFGVAKQLTGEGFFRTQTGGAMGTPAYMAPEQVRDARAVDERADIFSLGCILYELCCGKPPFTADDLPGLFNVILDGEYPPSRQRAPDLPERFHAAIDGCLRSEPSERLESCDVLLDVLSGAATPAAGRPAPEWTDDASRQVGEALVQARRQRRERASNGLDCEDLDGRILALKLELKRRLREGGQLQAGEFMADRYQLLQRVGRGGFATVWKAFDEQDDKLVAVKVLHGQFAHDRTQQERFFRGARMMARLEHPHIARVLNAREEEDGYQFFVMEYLPGGDLRDAVRAGTVTPDMTLRVVRQLAYALQYAHEQGLVHRDVKPQNVLMAANGDARLTDFDLVRARDSTGGTRTGGMGTFVYAAPEAMQDAKNADERADVYALGVTALFCLNQGDLPVNLVRDTSAFVDKLDMRRELRPVLKKATAWELDQRYPSMKAFSGALLLAHAAMKSGDTAPPVPLLPPSTPLGLPVETPPPELKPLSRDPATTDVRPTDPDARRPSQVARPPPAARPVVTRPAPARPSGGTGTDLRLLVIGALAAGALVMLGLLGGQLLARGKQATQGPLPQAMAPVVSEIMETRSAPVPAEVEGEGAGGTGAPEQAEQPEQAGEPIVEAGPVVAPVEEEAETAPDVPVGGLSISCIQPATVWVDGEERGRTPWLEKNVSVGSHVIKVKAASGSEIEFDLEVLEAQLSYAHWDLSQVSTGSMVFRPDLQAPQ